MVQQGLINLCLPLCPNNCETVKLETYGLTSKYPTIYEFDKLIRDSKYLQNLEANNSRDEIKKSLVYLRIFYDELKYDYSYQIPKMQITDLISIIGGTLGVCLGMSFLSIFELLTFIFDIVSTDIDV